MDKINSPLDPPKTYAVFPCNLSWKPDGDWNRLFWRDVEPVGITSFIFDKPDHFPKVQAKLTYDEEYIYVIFHVEDRYVRAVAKQFHDPVCRDSCVEFFFTPNEDIRTGYFNVEVNCGGVMLCRHQIVQGQGTLLTNEQCEQFQIWASLPKIVEPEIDQPTLWGVEYRVPLDILEQYTTVNRPGLGVSWRGNFYKCGDQTSHPHWLTWSPIHSTKPKFHLPEYFGTLDFC